MPNKKEADNWDEDTQPTPAEVDATHSFKPAEVQRAERTVSKVFGAELAPTAMALNLDELDLDAGSLDNIAVDATEVLDEYELVAASELIGVPFFIVGVNLNETDLTADGYYANVRCITSDNRKVCFNDGGTGVYTQLKRVLNAQPEPRPIRVRGGLRVSVYHVDRSGQITEGTPNAKTFYLSSSITASNKTKPFLSQLQ